MSFNTGVRLMQKLSTDQIITLLEIVYDELIFGDQIETDVGRELRNIINKLKVYYCFD